jgi:hypothetical protein
MSKKGAQDARVQKIITIENPRRIESEKTKGQEFAQKAAAATQGETPAPTYRPGKGSAGTRAPDRKTPPDQPAGIDPQHVI